MFVFICINNNRRITLTAWLGGRSLNCEVPCSNPKSRKKCSGSSSDKTGSDLLKSTKFHSYRYAEQPNTTNAGCRIVYGIVSIKLRY